MSLIPQQQSAPTARRAIWMLMSSFYPCIGGEEHQVQQLSKQLIAQDWTVNVLTRRHGAPELEGVPAYSLVDGIGVHRLYSKGSRKLAALWFLLGGLWYLLRHGRGAIYHARGEGASAWLAVTARRLLGGRAVVTLRSGRHAYEKANASGLRRRQFLAQLQLADRVVVLNSQVQDYVTALGVPTQRVVLLPNGVDTAQFMPATRDEKAALRQRMGLPADKKIIVFIGRLHPVKGLDVMLEAWAQLPLSLRQEGLLLIVGGGSEQGALQRQMTSLNLQDSVLMAGVQRNVSDYYHAADVFALPSRSEGLSVALAEAMACGLPSLCSAVGGAVDLIEEGVNGFLFPSEDIARLKEQLRVVLSLEEDRLASIGQAARRTIIAYADLSQTAEKVQCLYREMES